MLAQTNPLAHSEVIALGTLHGVAPGPVMRFEVMDGQARFGSALFPLVGVIDNHSDTDPVVLSLEDSAAVAGAYAALNLRVNGGVVASITVPPKSRVQFAVETLDAAKPFFRVSNAGLGWGRVGLHSFVGRIRRREV